MDSTTGPRPLPEAASARPPLPEGGTTGPRPLRADAARNAERLVRAARDAFAESGIDVPLEEVARRAGVGVATLYRRFPGKEELLQAVLETCYAEGVEPAIVRALADEDPWRALVTVLEAALTMAGEEFGILQAAKGPATLTAGLKSRFFTALSTVVERAQRAGLVRADLHRDDLPRLVFMLVSTLRLAERPADGWQRYLALVLDSLRPASATPLPPDTGLTATWLT
ncbi:TetR/AcrR family transcriptional regulator [Sphaerisporangium corydalis]|uniref:TetR/AcrR family transcriptional regulator n=1 Tax=Sphaerisporangium corydalis TaxID=1441875 RepID=A0ABV9EGX1_9ACTN|nr:TetR/AcrR family transcriptional regulator [Sphaerisporangium corydalis]